MQTSWNQWNNSSGSYAPSYSGTYPNISAGNSYQVPPTTTSSTSAVNTQYTGMYGQKNAQTPQQQWQQWEQWQQQYSQWQQQYGEKYQASMQSSIVPPMVTGMNNMSPMMPPLPTNTPVQPPPPNSAPPINKNEAQKRSFEGGPPDDSKKQKTGKNKTETLESLIESEKSFDQQFKDWESSFIQWKEQNVNHPDKVQYKEYEAKWERFREQLIQKRETLRKKREAKEAESTTIVKELSSNVLNLPRTQVGYHTTNSLTQSNPYNVAPPNMMFPIPNMYPASQPTNPFLGSFSMYNVPPPSTPQMAVISGSIADNQANKLSDTSNQTPSLEFLCNTNVGDKTIPGLGLVCGDKGVYPSFMTAIPKNSSLFSYNQDLTKPLHTSDDKPFNFPRPNQNYDSNDSSNQYAFRNRSRFDEPQFRQFNRANNVDRSKLNSDTADRFGNKNFQQNDFISNSSHHGSSAELSDDRNNLNATSKIFFTPNFNSEKYAKYLEDEYDDSRFRDPEPDNDFGRDSFTRDCNYQNQSNYRIDNSYYGKNDDSTKRQFEDSRNSRGGFNRQRFGNDRCKDIEQSAAGTFRRDVNKFGSKDQFGRGIANNRGTLGWNKDESNHRFDSANGEKFDHISKPVSLLDLPIMKPPDTFDKRKSGDTTTESIDSKPPIFSNTRFPESIKECKTDESKQQQNDVPLHNIEVALLPKEKTRITDVQEVRLQEPFEPFQIFEYDHISRSSNDDSSFEPIHIFDYAHGKKKSVDFGDLKSKYNVVSELLSETDQSAKETLQNADLWSHGGNQNNNESVVALPQRTRNVDSEFAENNVNKKQDEEFRKFQIEINGERTKTADLINQDIPTVTANEKSSTIPINDLLCLPGRSSRSSKLVIIMRGPPGSGKTFTAKLIKDKETEMGGSAPRILSIDDYFTVEADADEFDSSLGKKSSTEGIKYEYDEALEPSYLDSLVKSFKKTVTDGFFPFIIVDCVNEKLKNYEEMYNFAKSKGFRVYICELKRDLNECNKQNIHNRSKDDISRIIDEWEPTPSSHIILDVDSLLQSEIAIKEVALTESTDDQLKNEEEQTTLSLDESGKIEAEEPKNKDEGKTPDEEKSADIENVSEEYSSYMEVLCSSKWEKMEPTEEKLDRLDGISRQKANTSIKEWLQLPDESDLSWYTADTKTSGELSLSKKKRVRWADLEERVAQQKMRAIGFVVGHTDWNRMMDPSFGGDKLTQTKYI